MTSESALHDIVNVAREVTTLRSGEQLVVAKSMSCCSFNSSKLARCLPDII